MTMDRVLCFITGVALTLGAMGWVSEYRVRLAERGAFIERMLVHDEALRLALTNPVERGLAISQAVSNVLSRGARHPAARDDIPVGGKASTTR